MIKINRIPAPNELTPEVVKEKTERFKTDPNRNIVWKEKYIEDTLMRMSHSKCAYCECKLGEESKYMEVEHFHDKNRYKDEVVQWDNLLPSCKKCNVHKGNHDTITDPIIDPTKLDPKEHILFYHFMLKGKSELGSLTVDVLNLNDLQHHCLPRYQIFYRLVESIENINDSVAALNPDSTIREIKRAKTKVINLLQSCQNNEAYTAVKATIIAGNQNYNQIVSHLKKLGLWIEPLVSLDHNMRQYQLEEIH